MNNNVYKFLHQLIHVINSDYLQYTD